jgi:membrane protein
VDVGMVAGVVSRVVVGVDGYQRRHRWVGLPLGVAYKFADDQGGYLTALMTYYGFVSLFPLLLLLVTVLGFVVQNDPGLQQRVLDSALANFPVIGDQIGTNIHSFHGSVVGLVIGIAGSLYGGLGVVQATQSALNKMWGVSRNARPDPVRARLRSVLLLAVGAVTLGITTALSALSALADGAGPSGVAVRAGAVIAAIALDAGLFMVACRVLTGRRLAAADIWAGALLAGVVWQGLQWAGAFGLDHMVKGATATYGMFAIVLGLLAWIYCGALTFVACAELTVVRVRRLWPRSLLTPFTDHVDLTPADRRAYTSYAETEQHKGFQHIDVDFEAPPDRHADPG